VITYFILFLSFFYEFGNTETNNFDNFIKKFLKNLFSEFLQKEKSMSLNGICMHVKMYDIRLYL